MGTGEANGTASLNEANGVTTVATVIPTSARGPRAMPRWRDHDRRHGAELPASGAGPEQRGEPTRGGIGSGLSPTCLARVDAPDPLRRESHCGLPRNETRESRRLPVARFSVEPEGALPLVRRPRRWS